MHVLYQNDNKFTTHFVTNIDFCQVRVTVIDNRVRVRVRVGVTVEIFNLFIANTVLNCKKSQHKLVKVQQSISFGCRFFTRFVVKINVIWWNQICRNVLKTLKNFVLLLKTVYYGILNKISHSFMRYSFARCRL